MSDGALDLEQPTAEPAAEPPSFEQFSKDRKAGKVDATTGGDEINPAGNKWDAERNQFVNPVRDEGGRFSKVRESLAQSQSKAEYVKAVLEGAIQPDERMDPDTWAAARNAQIRSQSGRITPPNLGEETGAGAKTAGAPVVELSPADVKHFQDHDAMLAGIAAKAAVDGETQGALEGFKTAVVNGVPGYAVDYLGHCIAECGANAHGVFLALGKNPDAVAMYSQMPPEGMRRAVLALSREIAQNSGKARQTSQTKAPAPPDPVGARATATAFDVNDEKTDPEEWARQRNEQVGKRRGR